MSGDHTQVQVTRIPACDLGDGRPAAVDGRLRVGSWAYMCQECWDEFGVGSLGLGKGQRLILREPSTIKPLDWSE